MKLIDTHAHLDFDQFAGEEAAVLERAQRAGVTTVINVGTTLERSRKSVALAERFPDVYAAVGIHPHDAADVTDQAASELADLAKSDKVVAVGEIGFDNHYEDGPSEAEQDVAFRKQSELAIDLKLPLIIHSRDAESLTATCLKGVAEAHPNELPGVVHCFTGSGDFAKQVLELGYFISFTAPIGYPKNDALREVVKSVPLDRIMVETDCPFLAPQDKRGQRNEPAFVVSTAEKVAALKGLSLEEVARVTTANAKRLFALP